MKMNRNCGNMSKSKKLMSSAGNNSKPSRKSFQNASESSSISSNRNSSAQSEEDVRVLRLQANKNPTVEEHEQVVKKLQGQVKELKHKVRVLEESVESKDFSLGTIAREKDRAVGEIRRLERTNKQLRQQLSDERNHYLEEKEKFVEEMNKYKKRLQDLKASKDGKKINKQPTSKQSLISQSLKWQLNKDKGDFMPNQETKKPQKLSGLLDGKSSLLGSFTCSESNIRKAGSLESFHLYEGNDLTLQTAALRTENAKLRSIICERDERNYELCLRFLRMKHTKNDIRSRFQDLENEYLQVIANLMDKIDEARQEFNFIIDQKFKRPLHSTNAMYLQMVQRNSRMAFENASLRLENQCLKKELNKHVNGVFEDRKIDRGDAASPGADAHCPADAKSQGTPKKMKKNVNFKEIRTIYQRELNFKNSDTDSNYMSKTSTTVPSNGSLVDQKSKESVAKSEDDTVDDQDKGQPCFQSNSLPVEILNKIFKRIDTSCSQSVDSGRAKDPSGSEIKIKDVSSTEAKLKLTYSSPEEEIQYRQSQTSDKKLQDSNPVIIEHKSPPKITDSSSPCESKESVRIDAKETADEPLYFIHQFPGNADDSARRQEKPEQPRPLRHRFKTYEKDSTYYDKDSGDGSSSLEFPVRRCDLFNRNRLGGHERIPQFRDRFGRPIKDSCGLQEKLEVSDMELPLSTTVDTKIQTAADLSKVEHGARDKSPSEVPRIDVWASEDEAPGRRRSGSAPSPREELVEGPLNRTDENFWLGQQTQLHSVLSKAPPELCKMEKDGVFPLDLQFQTTEINQESMAANPESDATHARRSEASKRFSHRLISTSPEQLRSILTESQLGTCFRMAPIIVGHATTEIESGFRYSNSNNEIVLQLVIPTMVAQPSEILERGKLEKETSMSGLGQFSQGNLPVETCTSDVKIAVSSLQTSTSTMEMVDAGLVNDRNNIMLRTLSAPGLLESSWLDPYTLCEMRDCSTNT